MAVLLQQSQLGRRLRPGDQVVVRAGTAWRGDLYAVARVVRIAGRVDGDVVAVGQQVEISGEVTGDLLAVGGAVDVSGRVDGDTRLVGGQVMVAGVAGEDLLVAGGHLHFTSSARVGDDLVFVGAHTTMGAQVAGDMLGATGHYTFRGTVAGAVGVTTGGAETGISFSERVRRGVLRLIGILGVAAILLWLLPGVGTGAVAVLRRRPLASLGVGTLGMAGAIVLLLAMLLVVILLAVSLGLFGLERLVGVTLSTGILILAALAYLVFVVTDFAASAVAGLCLGRLALASERPGRWPAAAVLGILAVAVVTALPVVGCWLALLLAVVGLGALMLTVTGRRRSGPPPAASAR
ncbi:MAG TPA: polymer-forming cytoskeletal protein [Actinomycetes bacterium]|nr:polymer-forming cytoskeletal protein [Actinomycetes bacterium]